MRTNLAQKSFARASGFYFQQAAKTLNRFTLFQRNHDMPHQPGTNGRAVLTSLSKASFGIAGLAFLGSFACAAINHSLSGWMAVAGMAGLGLFYLALGVLNLGHVPKSRLDREPDSSCTAPYPHPRRYGDDLLAPRSIRLEART